MIIDYSFWRPADTDLHGVSGALRYLSHDAKKTTAAAELAVLHKAGVATGLVFEDAAERAAGGAAAGKADGEFCLTRAQALGVPAGRTIYTAADFDVPDYAKASTSPLAKLGPIGAYLTAFAAALASHYEAGAYGGYWLVSRALDAGLVRRGWQTVAWSGGHIDRRAALYQPGTKVFQGSADLDFAGWRDWGQWRRHTVTLTGAAA